jgi:hypothetical protein
MTTFKGRRLCEEIQADWTEREHLSRRHWQLGNGNSHGVSTLKRPNESDLPQGVEIQVIKVSELEDAA